MSKQKKKRQFRQAAIIAAAGFVAAALIGIIILAITELHRQRTATEVSVDFTRIDVKKPEITEAFLTPNVNSRPQKELKEVRGIVIHYTANPGSSAMANRNYFESRKDKKDKLKFKVSSHFIVGLEGEIIQCIPEDEIAYASNARNADTISIECCHPKKNGRFNEKTYGSLVRLCAWLCDTYEIKSRDDIIRHYDVTGKLCPKYYVRHEAAWDKLKDDIWRELTD